jgi:hypothetical protein
LRCIRIVRMLTLGAIKDDRLSAVPVPQPVPLYRPCYQTERNSLN